MTGIPDPDQTAAFEDRVRALREGNGPHLRRRGSRGVPLWVIIGGVVVIGGLAGAYTYSVQQGAAKRDLQGAEAGDFASGRPIATLPAATPVRIPEIVVHEALEDPEAARQRAEMEAKIASLNEQIEDLLQKPVDKPDTDLAALIDQLKTQNQTVLARLKDQERKAQNRLEEQEARLKTAFDSEMALMEAKLAAAQATRPVARSEPAVDRTAGEAERQRLARLAEREQAARDRANRQINSPGVLFDGGSALGLSVNASLGGSGESELPVRPHNEDEAFFASASGDTHRTVVASQLPYPSRTVVQGTLLHGVLETAIDSSLPGAIRASVSEDVWSYDGLYVLIPKGSRLIGSYRSDLDLAQERALIVWERAITPDGASMALGSFGSDRLGRSGLTGFVDTHFLERFGSAALISIIGAVPGIAVAESDVSRSTGDAATQVGEDFRSATSSVIQDYLRIQPTLYVDQGSEITVFVGRDLVIFDE